MRGHAAAHEHDGFRRLAWVLLAVSFLALLLLARPAESHAAIVCPSGTANLLPPGHNECRPVCETIDAQPPAVLRAFVTVGSSGTGTFAATARNPYDPADYDFKGNIECAVPAAAPNTWDVKKFCAQNAQFHCIHWHTYLAPEIGSPIPATALVTATQTVDFFTGWSSESDCAPSQNLAVARTICSILMDADKDVRATFETIPDSLAPSAPSLTVEKLTSHSVKLTWTTSVDDKWLGGYEIYRNGVLYAPRPRASATTTTLTFDNQLCKTTYDWQVRAFDSAFEAPSNIVSVFMGNTCVASKPPNTVFHLCVVGKYSRCSGAVRTTSSRKAYFHWGAARNGSEIAYSKFKSQCKLDGRAWTRCSPGKTYRRLHPGKHVVRVRAYDAAGKDKTPATYRWIVRR